MCCTTTHTHIHVHQAYRVLVMKRTRLELCRSRVGCVLPFCGVMGLVGALGGGYENGLRGWQPTAIVRAPRFSPVNCFQILLSQGICRAWACERVVGEVIDSGVYGVWFGLVMLELWVLSDV